jgi:hypothetical protein
LDGLYTTSNLNVTLPAATNGNYTVRVGLYGARDVPPVWQSITLTVDSTPPLLTITNPIVASDGTATLGVPLIQIQGEANERLSGLTYDISNAVEVVTNIDGLIMQQFFDTNKWDFTTNYFQCFDIYLTNGLNLISVHAADLAGNVTTTNLLLNLDYSTRTNPPAVSISWPADGMQIGQSSFEVNGYVDDPTATIAASVVDAALNTNSFTGVVERDGRFWVDNVPLGTGTNKVTLTVTDAAGNVAVTNFAVVQSAVTLTINTPNANKLWQPYVSVTGYCSDSSQTVSVNGVTANYTGGGYWRADRVPITDGGVALFHAAAADETESFIASSKSDTIGIVPESDIQIENLHYYKKETFYDDSSMSTVDSWDEYTSDQKYNYTWNRNDGGHDSANGLIFGRDGSGNFVETNEYGVSIVDTNNSPVAPYFGDDYGDWLNWRMGSEKANVQTNYQITFIDTNNAYELDITYNFSRTAQTKYVLLSGGRAIPGKMILHDITAGAMPDPGVLQDQPMSSDWGIWEQGWDPNLPGWVQAQPLFTYPPTSIQVGGFGYLNADGHLWVVTPYGAGPMDATPHVNGSDSGNMQAAQSGGGGNGNSGGIHDIFGVSDSASAIFITANGIDIAENTPDFCVGQHIKFDVAGTWDSAQWTLPGTFVNTNSDPNCDLFYEKNSAFLARIFSRDGTISTFCWYVRGLQQSTVSVTLYFRPYPNSGKILTLSCSGMINVHQPKTTVDPKYQDGTPTAQILGNFLSLGDNNRHYDMSFQHHIQTDNFSSGQAGYTQLITGGDIQTHTYANPITGIALDASLGEFPRGQPTVLANANTWTEFYDGPHVILADNDSETSEDVDFSTYLMFKPSGGIWVPLRLITWELHDSAIYNTGWTAINSHNGEMTEIKSDEESTDFPHWTTTY